MSEDLTTLVEMDALVMGVPVMCESRTLPSQPTPYFQSRTGVVETMVKREMTKTEKE
jgi:hypothetical protein